MIRVNPHGDVTVLADAFEGRRLNSPNDLVYRSDGALFFTDPPFGLPDGFDDPAKELPFSGVFMVRDGEVSLVTDELAGPNGLAFSPDERWLYVGDWDPERKVVMRYDLAAGGPGELLCDLTGEPGEDAIDGIKVDPEGNLYVCGPGGIWVLSPEGEKLGHDRAARGAAQPGLGRRRRPHALHDRHDQRLPHHGDAHEPQPRTRDDHPRFRPARRERREHRLSELQGDDLLVLHLSRGEHCPRERMHHREMLRFHEWSRVAFTELVTIMPNDPHDVFQLKISTGAHWTFLSDEGLETQHALRHRRVHGPPPRLRRRPAHAHPLPRPGDREGLRRLLVLGPALQRAAVGGPAARCSRRTKADFDPTTPEARMAWNEMRVAA